MNQTFFKMSGSSISRRNNLPKLPSISKQKLVKRVQFNLSRADSSSTQDESNIPVKKNLRQILEDGMDEEDDVVISQIEFEVPMRLQKTS